MRHQNQMVPVAAALLIAVISFSIFEVKVGVISVLLGWMMLGIAVSDARAFIIPDFLSLPSIPLGLVATYVITNAEPGPQVLTHLVAALVAAASLYAVGWLYYRVRGRRGLGLGDVKLAAAAGAWTGADGSIRVLLAACSMAMAFALIAHLRNGRTLNASTAIPFGLFLAPAIWLVWCLQVLSSSQSDFAASAGRLAEHGSCDLLKPLVSLIT